MSINHLEPIMAAHHTHDEHDHCGASHDHAERPAPVRSALQLLRGDTAPEAAPACACCHAPAPAAAAPRQAPRQAGEVDTRIRILQMDCPTEEALLRGKLGNMPGVAHLEFNLMQRVLTVSHQPAVLTAALDGIRSLGFTPEVIGATETAPVEIPAQPWWPLAIAGGVALGSEAVHWAGWPTWLAAALAIAAILACGTSTYRKGWIALRNGSLNINALMSIAVTGALLIGQWPEAAMVMVLFTVAERIEALSLDRARNAIRELVDLAPEQATVLSLDGNWISMPAKDVTPGTHVRVRPGERLALDGSIVSGTSTVDQSPITGESLPIEKTVGDPVFAGTINTTGSFEYTVTARASDSTLARITHAIAAAQGARAPMQRFVDRFARIYTPLILVIAIAVAVLPPLLFAGAWLAWVYKALVLLVIACPCALVISTPVTIVSGLATAARYGILIKGGIYLEEGRKLRWIAFDKTGTLTHGKPRQTDFAPLSAESPHRIRSLAASLAQRSDHPVSRALSEAATPDNVPLLPVSDFLALPGRGISGVIDGQAYLLGNHRLIHDKGLCSAELETRLSALEEAGKSVILLADNNTVHGLFAVADTVKDSSRAAIAELHALGVKTLMLSGDNAHTVSAIAKQVGIDEAHGDLLPEDKLKCVEQHLAAGTAVGMVGDGINDAPALARADIGFAMGAAGTGTAIETADVALMDDDLRKLARFIRLSRTTHAVLIQNIVMVLGIKAVFLMLTLVGIGSMWMAVFADVGASLLVIANGLKLLRR